MDRALSGASCHGRGIRAERDDCSDDDGQDGLHQFLTFVVSDQTRES